jgi:hypothetical protein
MSASEPIRIGDLVKVIVSAMDRIEIGIVTATDGAFVSILFFNGQSRSIHPVFIQKIKKNKESS